MAGETISDGDRELYSQAIFSVEINPQVKQLRNNKVWRQFTFTPITTSRIRVLVNAGADNTFSRVVEVEAWGPDAGESSSSSINWLVTDHLGTPRIIADESGSLAGIKRHDYLPFGEELFAGTGGRTTAQGYTASDNVRQKFTQKERDNETGLDYFGARFYGTIHGRFTSSDPLLSSGNVQDPQSWNRYSYTLNNPLVLTDPLGLFVWGNVSAEDKKRIREALTQAEKDLARIGELYGTD